MPENYRGYELNVPNDPKWGTRENTFHKQIIDKVLDNPIDSLKNSAYVAVNGVDATATGSIAKPFATIAAALASITDNSVNNPYVIHIAGGIFTESQSLNVGEGIDIRGSGDSTIIKTTNDDVNLFNMTNQSDLYNMTIYGPLNAKAISITEDNAIVTIASVKIVSSPNPIYIDSTDGTVNLNNLALRGGTVSIDRAIEIMAGDVNIYTLSFVGIQGTNVVYADGSNSMVHMWTVNGENDSGMSTLVYAINGAIIRLQGVRCGVAGTAIYLDNAVVNAVNIQINYPDIGVDMGPNGVSYLLINGLRVFNSTTLDMRIQNTNSSVTGQNNYLRDSKIEFTNGIPETEYSISHFSTDEGDVSMITKAELGVGSPDRPAEATFGEGDSYTRGMMVYTYDPTNGFVDVTVAAKSYSGSTFTFSDVVAESAIYASSDLKYGGDFVKFFGVKIGVSTSGDLGSGSTIAEYWNGSTWTAMSVMRTQGDAPYYPVLTPLITTDPGSYQMRFNARIDSTWVKNDPIGSGTPRYWARIRLISAITTSPSFEQIKLHSNRTEVNADGWIEYYGKARSIKRLPWNYGMVQAATASPGNQDQYLSDTLDVGKIENLFANNSVDRVGFLAPIPFDVDISTSIRFRWAVRYSDVTGNVIWNIRRGYSTVGDVVYDSAASAPTTHPTETLVTTTITVPTTTGQMVWHTVDIPVYDLNPRNTDGTSDILWVTIERDGTTDTFAGSAGLIAVSGDYLSWTNGGHL